MLVASLFLLHDYAWNRLTNVFNVNVLNLTHDGSSRMNWEVYRKNMSGLCKSTLIFLFHNISENKMLFFISNSSKSEHFNNSNASKWKSSILMVGCQISFFIFGLTYCIPLHNYHKLLVNMRQLLYIYSLVFVLTCNVNRGAQCVPFYKSSK